MNGLAAGGLFNAVPVSSVAKSPDVSLLHFFPVADERSERTPIWACQRMGLPSSLSGEKKRNTDWQCLMLVKAKDLRNSFSSHLVCFLFCTLINLETAAEGLKDHSAATVLQPPVPSHSPAPAARALGSVSAWRPMVPA